MIKPNIRNIRKQLEEIRKITAKEKSPLTRMTEEQIIKKLRKDREDIWKKKFASRS